MSTAKRIYQSLLKHKVKDVFMYSGGSIMPLVDQFYKGPINYYINANEQCSGYSATGYAKSSNKTGVAITTSGPGLTNIVTAIQDAQSDSTPLVVLSGQVSTNVMGTNAFQECPATDITKAITKWNYCITDPYEVEYVMDKAFFIANDKKRGAVHIDLPKSVLGLECSLQKKFIPEIDLIYNSQRSLEDIIKVINNAERPVVIVGKGARDEYKLIRRLISDANLPVTTTLHAVGTVDERHPLSLKFLGMHGSPTANYAVQYSDCILAIGSRFDDRTIGNVKEYAPDAKIIHVNCEKSEINKVIKSDYCRHETSYDFLTKILISDKLLFKPREAWFKRINQWKTDYPFAYAYSTNKLQTSDVISTFNKYIDHNNTYITTGVGNHQMLAAQLIDYKYPGRYITSGSLGVMGTGLPYAIGVQIANPRSIVINIDGDGSFNHTSSDLQTIVRYKLPVKIAIMDDGQQSMVRIWEKLFFNERYTATANPNNPDYVKLGESFGIMGIYCDNKEDLNNSVRDFLCYKGPVIGHFKVESGMCFPLVPPGKRLDQMLINPQDKLMDLSNEAPS